ncbi:NAD(P)H-hydrate dehydratase [Tsuneonella sp. HG222]
MPAADQVLTVAQMRAAEQALIDRGETVSSLMDIAGRGAAEWVWRVSAGRKVTVLCGPGNNGGDGYVIAETLRVRGLEVCVVAPLAPTTEAAIAARAAYRGSFAEDARGGVLVDCLFGSGLTRPLSPDLAALLARLADHHDYGIAVDLPSGVASDTGALLNEGLPAWNLTIALGAWKFAHWRMPAMAAMERRVLVDIGVEPQDGAAQLAGRPKLSAPAADAHKYTRGLVLVVAGTMPGAAVLACHAALRAGAGAVRLKADSLHPATLPDVVLRADPLEDLLADPRTGAVLVGPGLGRDEAGRAAMTAIMAADLPAVIDADALHLATPEAFAGRTAPAILTPHEGELAQLCKAFGVAGDDKLAAAKALAQRAGAVIVAKGPDTIIAGPDGRVSLAPSATSWLSVAGSGDVLAGIAASRLAAGGDPFAAALEACWLHNEAARLTAPPFLASDLAGQVARAYAACL